ncbi:hypothetical protein GH714_013262 [Hevea brasiliensis]|uniref:EGF-like domain-containing protein n=1 Tax=Hevea brasiliensis TaxID=3981 RepID=A0A6A6K5G8_HEVBR|nr:hypothetical protein GH714_005475 [Hevea brasiliensis]KAF2283438.1 hypothetical protein GH714_005499 [Hevea brasiliensis]KAF2283646.1 hypothetical protein GH714_013204 [Hevea brasiliensis]KAF2283652.1 hypothetical protein GH714_013262 [Hevea brasiliensis]
MISEGAQLALIIISSIFLVTSTKVHSHNSSIHCQKSCGTGDSVRWVPYPFGFSDGCSIRLNCTQRTGEIKIGDFQVQNITPNGILMILPAECNRILESIKPLFGQYYAPAWRNGLLLQNCSRSLNNCLVRTSSFSNQFDIQRCDSKSDNINCYSQQKLGMDILRYENLSSTNCEFLFSSFAVGSSNDLQLSLEFERIQLDWWLEGNCTANSCAKNGNCTIVTLSNGKNGHRCQCNEGFAGDGFKVKPGDGAEGCRRVSGCNASKYMNGKCGGTTRVGVLVGGLIAGALLMAGLALICYFVRRRSTSLRHSEVNLAALAIDRIGRGCVDEIIDPYLDPHRDAWTLSSIHNVAELAFRCLAFHRDMRPTMMEVAEELELIRLSAWVPNMYSASSAASFCSSPDNGSEKSLGVSSVKKTGVASWRLLVPQRAADHLTSLEEVKDPGFCARSLVK